MRLLLYSNMNLRLSVCTFEMSDYTYSEKLPACSAVLLVLISRCHLAGAGHTQVAKTGRRLVSVYKQQNRPAEAESILTRILTFVTGMSEVEKIRIVNSIAILQKKQGKLMEAETMYLRAVNMYGLLGDDSLTVCREDHLATLNNLGLLYKTKKEFMLSRRYYDEAYSGRKEFFGMLLLFYILLPVCSSTFFLSSTFSFMMCTAL